MKTNLQKLFLLAIIFLTPNIVQAESACSYSEQAEINNIVANVKASYETVKVYGGKTLDLENPDESGNFKEVDYYIDGIKISILNITEDIYVRVSNNLDDNVLIFNASNTTDGIATFQTTEVNDLITYKIEIFANKYNCVGEKFREINLTTPIYNEHSTLQVCEENPDFYYCQEFITTENISLDDFLMRIKEYQKRKEENKKEEESQKNWIERIKEFYHSNALILNGIGIIIIASGVTTTAILIKKRRSRVL